MRIYESLSRPAVAWIESSIEGASTAFAGLLPPAGSVDRMIVVESPESGAGARGGSREQAIAEIRRLFESPPFSFGFIAVEDDLGFGEPGAWPFGQVGKVTVVGPPEDSAVHLLDLTVTPGRCFSRSRRTRMSPSGVLASATFKPGSQC